MKDKKSVAKFLKTDLHIHSKSSDGGKDCKDENEFIDKLFSKIKELNIDVFSITDHNLIDYDLYDKLFEKFKNENTKILYGIEMNLFLDSNYVIKHSLQLKDNSNNDDYFQAIFLFDETIKENNFFNNEDLFKWHSDSNLPDWNAKIFDYEKIISFFIENDIQYYFIPHENKDSKRDISSYLPNKKKNNEDWKSKLFFFNRGNIGFDGTHNSETSKNNNNKLRNIIRKNHKINLSSFEFSDAHNIDEIGKKFTWIKFDGTFEDLISPFTDPKTRIIPLSVSEKNPQKNTFFIEKIKFKVNQKQVEINLSPGLNSLIGAKGSGKSLFSKIISDNVLNEGNLPKIEEVEFKYSNAKSWSDNFFKG